MHLRMCLVDEPKSSAIWYNYFLPAPLWKIAAGNHCEPDLPWFIRNAKAVDAMKPFTISQLREILGTDRIAGTPEQIEMFAIRIAELAALNGRAWVRQNAQQLLNQWHCAVRQRADSNDQSR
jgi:hypothetical protein